MPIGRKTVLLELYRELYNTNVPIIPAPIIPISDPSNEDEAPSPGFLKLLGTTAPDYRKFRHRVAYPGTRSNKPGNPGSTGRRVCRRCRAVGAPWQTQALKTVFVRRNQPRSSSQFHSPGRFFILTAVGIGSMR